MSLMCAFIHLFLVKMCTNPILLSTFRCRCSWTLELMNWLWSYPDLELSFGFDRPSCFRGFLLFYSSIRRRHYLVEYVLLVFLSLLFSYIVLVPFFGKSIFYTDIDYVFHLIILVLDGCCERLWVYEDSLIRIQCFSL